ncbi:LLM class flavin-dependent oxidoreductase [Trinickia mobilis]|uniref:LLM class flavin-dependent oxidoreductase n=1 Tax=Trinickia mobilis TaxID=2816356 RepID=UPI001A90C7D4|nr:LLM class flavin-dependent oxidoreductase [Trinickia mobilis]
MKLGLFQMPLHPANRPFHETLKENARKIIYADKLGFDQAWVGEHFSATTEPIAAPMMFMASLLPQTKNIVFGTGVVALPNHNPVIVAAEAAQFDHMSEGRFMFGIGPSGLSSDHELFGNTDGKVRTEKLLESIDIITRIWQQDPPYDIQGKYWQVKITESIVPSLGIGYMPKPYQRPLPPIAMSAMSPYSSTVKTAAERGWMPISANFCPEYIVASHFKKYVKGFEAVGRAPDGKDWLVARNIVIADSEQEALDAVLDPKGSLYYYFDYLWTVMKRANYTVVMKEDPNSQDDSLTTEDLIRSMTIYGSPATVTEKLAAFRERVGPFGGLLMSSPDGSGPELERQLKTMRHLALDVMPKLRSYAARQETLMATSDT